MLQKNKKGVWILKKLAQKKVIHAFSCRQFGNCQIKRKKIKPQEDPNWPGVKKFLNTLDLKPKNLVLMEQVHGSQIKVVDHCHRGQIIARVDGLLTRKKDLILGIKTADCLPLLFADPLSGVIGAAHAGWRGVLQKLPAKMIELMIRLGSLPEDILLGVGPFIGPCCYNFGSKEAACFEHQFSCLPGMIKKRQNKIFLDLAVPVKRQLLHSGLLAKNLEWPGFCTSCHNQEFFFLPQRPATKLRRNVKYH